MICAVFDDIRAWLDRGFVFGHVAINTAAAVFRTDSFAEVLLEEIGSRRLEPHMIELELTEGVFLGRGSQHVARALMGLGKSLGIATVAEGIETMAQADFVRTQGSTSGRDICSAPHNRLSASRP